MMEIEFKLRATAEELLRRFDPAPEESLSHRLESSGIEAASNLGFSVLGRRQLRIADTYYDTTGHRLFSSDISVRVREEEGKVEITIKLPVQSEQGPFVRQELTAPLSPDRRLEITGSTLLTLLSSFRLERVRFNKTTIGQLLGPLMEEPLQPTLLVRNERVVVDFEMGDSNFLALYLDLYTLGIPETPLVSPSFAEVELEYLLDWNKSSYERVRNVSWKLQTTLGLKPSSSSKYQQGVRWFDVARTGQS